MDDGFLMSVLHALADTDEKVQALACAQLVLVAVLRDGNAGNVLHHEVRPALRSGAGIEHLGDGRMVHERQRLALGFKPRHHFTRVHADLD